MNGICPKCGKWVHGVVGHARSCTGNGEIPILDSMLDSPPSPTETAPMNQPSTPPAVDLNAVAEIASRAATEASTRMANDILSQLPGLVDKMLTARIDQLTARIDQLAAGNHSSPQVEQAQPHPPSSSRLAEVAQIVAMIRELGLFKAEQPNPTSALVQQMEMMSSLIGAIDRIRGTPQSSLPPKTALDWAKWGYGLGKSGAPEPSFDTITVPNPPGKHV